jgi:twitching motility protein PilT
VRRERWLYCRAVKPEDILLGRLAVHYKLVDAAALEETAMAWQASGGPDFGIWLVDRGILSARQVGQLKAARREYQERRAAAPSAGIEAEPVVEVEERPSAFEAGGRILLGWAVGQGASDIHIHQGSLLQIRRHGQLEVLAPPEFTAEDIAVLVELLLPPESRRLLDRSGQADLGFALEGVARFRGNVYRRQGGTDIVLRVIPPEVPTFEQLGLPQTLEKLIDYHQGLVLVTGPTGCGKSTTLASLVATINRDRRDHVVSIEDPIEFLHPTLGCLVNQRQVGRDTETFARALRAALREDPDVIVIGEMRDLETISLALTAAETGHLVLGSLHTGNAIRTIDRIVGVFPPSRQGQIRAMLSESLRAVISQRLLRRADGGGRVPALEILLGTRAVANMIRESKTFQLRSVMQTGASQGMVLLDTSLAQLVKAGVITRDEALLHCEDPKTLPPPAGAEAPAMPT